MNAQTPCPEKIRSICETVKESWGASTMATRRQSAIERQRELAELLNLRTNDSSGSGCYQGLVSA
jgi:hypothetical protein